MFNFLPPPERNNGDRFNRMNPCRITIRPDRIRNRIVTADTKGDQVINHTFIRDLGVAAGPVMHFQPPQRSVMVAQSAAIAIQIPPGLSFFCPSFGRDIGVVIHGTLHKTTKVGDPGVPPGTVSGLAYPESPTFVGKSIKKPLTWSWRDDLLREILPRIWPDCNRQ